MEEFRSSHALISYLSDLREKRPDIVVGLVPTMGALHDGHIHLLKQCKTECDIAVMSIFVNPTQFNEKSDLDSYPRNEGKDIRFIESHGCDIVFLPQVEDIYPQGSSDYQIELGILDTTMEGEFRPNHFVGVSMVVERFFEIAKPNRAYFGEKDFQQLAVIRKMNEIRKMGVDIVGVDTYRSKEGLALSSRNELLNPEQLESALHISATFEYAKEIKENFANPQDLKATLISFFNKSSMRLEYLEIVDGETFLPAENYSNARICLAAYCAGVRLIDNSSL